MRLTSLPTPLPSNSTQNAITQAKTLRSLYNWWMKTKELALAGICHCFILPHENQLRFSLKIEPNQSSNSSLSPFGYSVGVEIKTIEHPVKYQSYFHNRLFIVLVTALITCITHKERTHVLFFWFILFSECISNLRQPDEYDFMPKRVSNHTQRRTKCMPI